MIVIWNENCIEHLDIVVALMTYICWLGVDDTNGAEAKWHEC
jgi:hypothetical protein